MRSAGRVVRIRRIRLENVRGFRSVDLSLRQTAVVIGRNSTNKTTLLRAIALGLADSRTASALLAQPVGRFVRSGAERALIEVEVETEHGEKLVVAKTIRADDRGDAIEQSTGELFAPVFGYGAARGIVGGDSSRSLGPAEGVDEVLSLFDYRKELSDPELTLRRLQDGLGSKHYPRTMAGFRRVLELGPQDRIELATGGGIEVAGPTVGGGPIPLSGWADGYRLTLTWLIDLYGRAARADAIDRDGNVRGILLVDELEQHLHPSLQAGMVDYLRELLPGVQLIATTHSPLLALGAQSSELVVLRRHGDEIQVADDVPDYRGFSAEDMLADDRLFDTPVYAPKEAAQLARYNELIGRGLARTKKEEAELLELARTMRAEPLSPVVDEKVAEAFSELERRLGS
jgi:predicted ATP-binding protein involved in virulence